MDTDLDRMTRDQLIAEIKKLRTGIREHRDSREHELCWHHPALWGLLPEKTDPIPVVPEWPELNTRVCQIPAVAGYTSPCRSTHEHTISRSIVDASARLVVPAISTSDSRKLQGRLIPSGGQRSTRRRHDDDQETSKARSRWNAYGHATLDLRRCGRCHLVL